jgi:CelD/BcsL family acetyltransferase involved in cellulose biosynthesis
VNRLSSEVLDHIDPVSDEWEGLAERVRAAPFLRPGWIRAWRDAFGRGKLVLLTARRDARLVGVLPLERHRGALRSPTNAHTPEFGPLAEDEQAAEALAEEALSQGVRAVSIARLGCGSPLEVLRRTARRHGYRVVVRPSGRMPYLRCLPTLAEHERALSRNLRHDVERRLRRLVEHGAVSIQVWKSPSNLDELLDEAFRVEQLGWKGGRGTAIASEPRTRRFYSAVAHWGVEESMLRLAFLRVDERAIAFQLDLESADTYYSLKIGYDPSYEQFSPGKLLAYSMASRAVCRGLASYELLGTDEVWKQRWTDAARDVVDLHAFAATPAGYLTWSVLVPGKALGRHVPLASRAVAALRR